MLASYAAPELRNHVRSVQQFQGDDRDPLLGRCRTLGCGTEVMLPDAVDGPLSVAARTGIRRSMVIIVIAIRVLMPVGKLRNAQG